MAIVLFDGTCNLCSGGVRFVAANDPAAHFRFAPLHSSQGAAALARFGRTPADVDGIVLIDGDAYYERSGAALRIAAELRAPWGLARFLLAVPERVRDGVYALVARHRYELFGRRDVCALPEPSPADRFLR